MCFNSKVSLFTFSIGVIFSVILIQYGNPKYKVENTVTGMFTIFIAIIQLMEFLFWIDLKNTFGINQIATIIGPLINVGEPLILYIIKYLYYQPNIFSLQNYHLPVALMNIAYFIYFIVNYIRFVMNEKMVTTVKDGTLSWPWIRYFYPSIYSFVLAVNIFYLFPLKYSILLFGFTYLFLLVSMVYFKYHVGELWCFFGAFIPVIMYFLSFHIDTIFG